MTLLMIPTRVSTANDRPASYGNQIISSTRPYICYIHLSTATRWVWSTLRPTIRCLYHWPANEVDSAWDDQPLTYTQKAKKSLFEPPFRALRGSVCTPSMARWKARGRLYIRRNWTFLTISYGSDVMSGNQSKSAFFEGEWVTLNADFRGKGASPSNHSCYQSSRVIALSCGIKISAVRHLVLSQCMRVTDGRTELWLPRPPSHMVAR